MTERRLFTRHEVAKLLNQSLSFLEKLKEIPMVKLGRSVRYDSADLWAWIETKKPALKLRARRLPASTICA